MISLSHLLGFVIIIYFCMNFSEIRLIAGSMEEEEGIAHVLLSVSSAVCWRVFLGAFGFFKTASVN